MASAGDGFADVVIGASGESSDDGAAYVHHGGPRGLSATAALVLRGAAYIYHGGSSGLSVMTALVLRGADGSGGWFVVSVASAGDVNGDGFADVIIGAYTERSFDGAAYAHHGGPSDLSATGALVLRGPAGAGGWFGRSVMRAGRERDPSSEPPARDGSMERRTSMTAARAA